MVLNVEDVMAPPVGRSLYHREIINAQRDFLQKSFRRAGDEALAQRVLAIVSQDDRTHFAEIIRNNHLTDRAEKSVADSANSGLTAAGGSGPGQVQNTPAGQHGGHDEDDVGTNDAEAMPPNTNDIGRTRRSSLINRRPSPTRMLRPLRPSHHQWPRPS